MKLWVELASCYAHMRMHMQMCQTFHCAKKFMEKIFADGMYWWNWQKISPDENFCIYGAENCTYTTLYVIYHNNCISRIKHTVLSIICTVSNNTCSICTVNVSECPKSPNCMVSTWTKVFCRHIACMLHVHIWNLSRAQPPHEQIWLKWLHLSYLHVYCNRKVMKEYVFYLSIHIHI